MNVSHNEHHLLTSMLGAGDHVPDAQRGYRNRFAAARGTDDHTTLIGMLEKGLVKQGHEGKDIIMFYATEAGCKAIDLTPAQIKRALED